MQRDNDLVYALLLLIITALVCWGMSLLDNVTVRARAAWIVSVVGVAGALGLALVLEGMGSVAGKSVVGAEITSWLRTPIYTSDALSTGVGVWCLALGNRGSHQDRSPADRAHARIAGHVHWRYCYALQPCRHYGPPRIRGAGAAAGPVCMGAIRLERYEREAGTISCRECRSAQAHSCCWLLFC